MCCHHFNRREFLGLTTAMAAGAGLASLTVPLSAAAAEWPGDMWNPDRPFRMTSKPLRVQPVLMYSLPTRREAASWKSWGGIQTEQAVGEEVARITDELKTLSGRAGFPMEVRPVMKVTSVEEAASARAADADVVIVYPATGSGRTLRACFPEQGGIIFVRHRSGPVYYWYEALSTRYLKPDSANPRAASDDAAQLSVHDVVVDDADELLWRLRALFGVRNFVGARVVALGGAQGKYAEDAPKVAREKFKLDIVEVSYEDLGKRIQAAMADGSRMALAEKWTARYAAVPNTEFATDRQFVVNAFMLYGAFKDIVQEHGAAAFTINECMNTILPMAKTTACLTLSLLNDEGLPTFCESDFVVVPAGILLHYISGKPVFMHNSTFPHNAMLTCAHCTAPRRMDASRYEPVKVLTHYESEYGAAPKIEMPVGQEVTCIDPEYTTGRWVGIKGVVESNPFFDICRSQQDVRIVGNWKKLLNEARDSHWMMAYGDYLREIGYAAPRIGITWDNISEA